MSEDWSKYYAIATIIAVVLIAIAQIFFIVPDKDDKGNVKKINGVDQTKIIDGYYYFIFIASVILFVVFFTAMIRNAEIRDIINNFFLST